MNNVTHTDRHFETSSALDSCLSTIVIDAIFDRSAPFVVGSQKKPHILVSDERGNTRNSSLKLRCIV